MKPTEFKNKAEELSYYISKALEALIKEDISKAGELYHRINKLKKELEPEEKGMFDGQVKRLEKEIKLSKKKIGEAEIKKATTKASTVVTGIFIIALIYLFLEPGITGLYAAQNSAPLSSIPNFYLEIGKEFSLKVYPDDPSMENIVFSDDSRLFSVSKDGLLRFTPTEEMRGTHYVAIIAKDGTGWYDLKIVKFVIGDKEFIEGKISIESKISEEIMIENETKAKEESIDVIVKGINETVINVTEPINETIEELKNETIELVNLTIELNGTETNESVVEISDLEYEKIIVENFANQTVNENLTNQTD